MKKYFLNNGEEIKFGDIVNAVKNEGWKKTIITCTFDKDSIDFLKELGIIIEKDVEEKPTKKQENPDKELVSKIPYLDYVLDYVAGKIEVSRIEAVRYLNALKKINPLAALTVYLKRISYKLNKNYDNTPIRELSEIYIISAYDGKVTAICPKHIKNLRHFAWFRSKEDAEFARRCVINLIEKMFGKDDQSKD